MASNRSPSPFSSRNCKNSEAYSTTRRSFSGNPFTRPTALQNPKSLNPTTPANTPNATVDHTKRNLITRKSINGGSMVQDGKENRKDALRSPAKTPSRNFMSPTISAASKFTPSPRRKILGEKNEVTRASIEFLGKISDLNSEPPSFTQAIDTNDESHELKIDEQIVEQKEVVHEVNLSSVNDDSGFVKSSTLCCSPITSPVIATTDSDPHLPPYDPKKNFLSPRPQFLRYKPNPRIEFLLNKEGDDDYEEDDVTRLEDSFNLVSDNSSEETEQEQKQKQEQEQEKEAELGDDLVDSDNGSSEDLSETVLEQKSFDSKVEKASKPRFFTRSKTTLFVFVLFLVACFSLSFTESPPFDLPIYEDVGFSEIYHGSLRFAAFAKESFDELVENVKQLSVDLVSYISKQKSLFIPTQKIESLQFFNLTTSQLEEFQFNRHIGTDYIEEIHEFEEETEMTEEEIDVESDVVDEVVTEEQINEQIQSDDVDEVQETETESEATHETESEMVENEVEIESNLADSNGKLTTTIYVAGFFMVVMAVSAVYYTNRKKSNASKPVTDNMREESGSSERSSNNVQKGNKKKTNSKRESLASSSSDFSTSDSFGSFTTFERIAIKHKEQVMLTPIRRSSRLLKH